MTCLKASSLGGIAGSGSPSGGGYKTEAECLQACRDGACCEGTTCSVTPQCQCQGTGKVFKGVGTVCEPGTCSFCLSACPPESLSLTVSCEDYIRRIVGTVSSSQGTRKCGFVSYFPGSQYAGTFVMQRVSATVYEYVFSQTPTCSPGSFVRFDLQQCRVSASLRMLWETDMSNWPNDTFPRPIQSLDCNPGDSTAVAEPGSYRFANQAVLGLARATNEGPNPLFVSEARNCSSIYADPPVNVSFVLPVRWWLEADFVGFSVRGDFQVGGSPPTVIEQSGSREVSFSVSAIQNPLP